MQGQNSQLAYDDLCKLVGHLYISSHAATQQSQSLIESLTQELASLREENRKLREQWTSQNEST